MIYLIINATAPSLLLSIWNLNNIVSIELLIKLIQVLLLMLHHLYAEQS